jgi:scyllo-inositol 2-dehydrogenase (NADP+)
VCDFTSATTIQKPRYLIVGRDATFAKYGNDPQEQALIKTGQPSEEGLTEDESQYGRLKVGATGEERVIKSEPGRWKCYYEDVRRRLQAKQTEPVSGLSVTLEQVRRQIAVIEAGIQSARSGTVVSLSL